MRGKEQNKKMLDGTPWRKSGRGGAKGPATIRSLDNENDHHTKLRIKLLTSTQVKATTGVLRCRENSVSFPFAPKICKSWSMTSAKDSPEAAVTTRGGAEGESFL